MDSKGIMESYQENNWWKLGSGFAIRDVIDGNDYPLLTVVAGVEVGCGAAAAVVKISVAGGFFVKADIDLFDPYPEGKFLFSIFTVVIELFSKELNIPLPLPRRIWWLSPGI